MLSTRSGVRGRKEHRPDGIRQIRRGRVTAPGRRRHQLAMAGRSKHGSMAPTLPRRAGCGGARRMRGQRTSPTSRGCGKRTNVPCFTLFHITSSSSVAWFAVCHTLYTGTDEQASLRKAVRCYAATARHKRIQGRSMGRNQVRLDGIAVQSKQQRCLGCQHGSQVMNRQC